MEDKIAKILISKEQLQNRISELANKINEDYKGKSIVLVGILRGAVLFRETWQRR